MTACAFTGEKGLDQALQASVVVIVVAGAKGIG